MQKAIENFFDNVEKYGDKQTKNVLKRKVTEITEGNSAEGNAYQRKNIDYIRSLD